MPANASALRNCTNTDENVLRKNDAWVVSTSAHNSLSCASPLSNTPTISHVDPRKRSFSPTRSAEHTSELQSLMRISYAVFCLKKKKRKHIRTNFNKECQARIQYITHTKAKENRNKLIQDTY